MGLMGIILKSGIYFAALIGVFTLLPLPQNVTIVKYSVTPQKPLTGNLAINNKLSSAYKVYEDKFKGPEGLIYHEDALYTSVHGGHVIKIVDDQITPVVKFGKVCDGLYEEHICGRPLGINIDKNGFLYVTDAYYGVYKVNVNSSNQYGTKEQLVSMEEIIEGARPKIPNSVVVASDGTVYWTDSDTNYSLHDGLYTLFVDGTGRLIKYDPKTKKNTVLIRNLNFANGVELANDESFLLVVETVKYRVHKYYLKGPNAGKSEIFIDGLPGMPDNVKKIGRSFYFPLVIDRIPGLDIIGEYPIIRMMIVKFLGTIDFTFKSIDSVYPNLYCKKAIHWVGHFESISFIKSLVKPRLSVIKTDEKGNIISSWYSTEGNISGICDVEVVDDKLYLGSPFNNFLGVVKLPYGFL